MFEVPGTVAWNALSTQSQILNLDYYTNIKLGVVILLLIYIIYRLHKLSRQLPKEGRSPF